MKASFLAITLLLSMSTLYSCNDSKSVTSTKESNAVTQEQLNAGNSALVEVNTLEKNLKHLKFSRESSVVNGAIETSITLNPSIDSESKMYEAKYSLELYVAKLQQFLKDYPASKYILTGRSELETKLDLAKEMLTQINERT